MPRDLTRYRGALLHRSRWLHLGVHARDLASDRFTTVFPGYLTPTEHPASFNALAWALQNRVRPGSVLSHTTAALLWGIPLPWRLEDGVGMPRPQELAPDVEDPFSRRCSQAARWVSMRRCRCCTAGSPRDLAPA